MKQVRDDDAVSGGPVVTVFRSRLRPDAAAYAAHAARMGQLARTMPGYLEHKTFLADDGERVTLVWFEDAETQAAWADHPEHREAQRAGIADYYEEYSLTVARVERAWSWSRSPG